MLILRQCALDDYVEFLREFRPENAQRWRIGGGDFVHGGQSARAAEGMLPAEDFVEHYAERENVGTSIENFTVRLFRRHVSNCAENHAGLGERAGRLSVGRGIGRRGADFHFGQTEVEHFGVSAARNENIGGLEIAVNDALRVCCGDGVGDFDRDLQGSWELELAIGEHVL